MKNRNGYEDDSNFEDSFQPSETYGSSPFNPANCPMTKILIAVTSAVWLLQILLFKFAQIDLTTYFGLIPQQVLRRFEVWRLVTMALLHLRTDLFHIVFNMLGLWLFGRAIEQRLGMWRFLRFYVYSQIAASFAYLVVHLVGGQYTVAIGASGAIMGIMVLFACLYPDATLLMFLFIPMKAKHLVLLLVAIDLLYFVVLSAGDNGIAHSAHLGGAAFGFLYFRYTHRFTAWLHGWETHRERRDRDRQRVEKQALDDILEKISREGMTSLSSRERRFLKSASRRVRERME
ncbi:MAG: rhomboid family intramembrane serine protease [Planctomycetes bacterium]|nr:rhomboid family intramembrane serine protease [Planctomycetota bacterium]MBI3844450.1 rhomboid family intramembrane serine protease [Planctomycetota bacterium]